MIKGMRKKQIVIKWNKFLLTDNKLIILFHIYSSNFSFLYYYVPFFILTFLSTLTTMTKKIQPANKVAEHSEKRRRTTDESMYIYIYILYMLKSKMNILFIIFYCLLKSFNDHGTIRKMKKNYRRCKYVFEYIYIYIC